MKRSMTHRRASAGYSLVELMIALTTGALVISSTYFIGAASSRHFQEQQRIGQTQMGVRLAMDQLQRDIARAGYLGTGSSLRDQRCRVPAFEVQAVEFQNDVDNAMIPNAGLNRVSADRLTLVGSYASNDSYIAATLNASGDALFLQTRWQMFRRNFGLPPIDAAATGAFASMFDTSYSENQMVLRSYALGADLILYTEDGGLGPYFLGGGGIQRARLYVEHRDVDSQGNKSTQNLATWPAADTPYFCLGIGYQGRSHMFIEGKVQQWRYNGIDGVRLLDSPLNGKPTQRDARSLTLSVGVRF